MRLVKFAIIALAIILIIFAGTAFWTYRTLTSPAAHTKAGQYITIEKGLTPSEIVDKLVGEGVLKSTFLPLLYLRLTGGGSRLQAGEYNFDSPITPLQVFDALAKGEEQTIRLTIPEGFNRLDIAKRIVQRFPQNPPVTEREVLALMDDTTSIRDIAPEARNLEGYLYPSTYSFPRRVTIPEIIAVMTGQFKKVWRPEWTDQARNLGRTPYEIVIIASLIETEASIAAERPVVASVIYNRMAKKIPLGIDMTAIYVAKVQNRWDGTINRSDVEVDSPYNTRKYGGLPPGPISSVSESAIAAALNPATTDYLYYVRKVEPNDGSHSFYSSAAEFEKGKAEYQRWLEQQREKKRAEEAGNQQ